MDKVRFIEINGRLIHIDNIADLIPFEFTGGYMLVLHTKNRENFRGNERLNITGDQACDIKALLESMYAVFTVSK